MNLDVFMNALEGFPDSVASDSADFLISLWYGKARRAINTILPFGKGGDRLGLPKNSAH